MKRFTTPALTSAFLALLLAACGDDDSSKKTENDDDSSGDAGATGGDGDGENGDKPGASEDPEDSKDPEDTNDEDPAPSDKFKHVYYSDAFATYRVDVESGEAHKLNDFGGYENGLLNPFLVSPAATYLADNKKVLNVAKNEYVYSPPPEAGNANILLFLSNASLLYQSYGQAGFKEISLKDGSQEDVPVNYDYCTVGPDSLLRAKKLLAIACKRKVVLWDVEARKETSVDGGDGSYLVAAGAWLDDSTFAFGTGEGLYVQPADLSEAIHKDVGWVGGVISAGPGRAWFTAQTKGDGGLLINKWYSVDTQGNTEELAWLTALNPIVKHVAVSHDGSQVLIWNGSLKLYASDGSGERQLVSGDRISAPVGVGYVR